MAVNPPTTNRGHAKLVATSVAGGTQTYDLTLDGSGTTWPNNYKEASSFTCTVTNVSAGTTPPTLGVVLAVLVEDAVDVAGNYVTTTGGTTLTTGVLAIVAVTAAVSGGTSFTFGSGASRNPALSKFGTFRIVLCAGDTLNNALRATDTTAGADLTYHENTDQDNNKKGSLQTATFGTFITGLGGIKCALTAASRSAGNWKYHQDITASFTLKSIIDGTSNPYNDTGAALKNLKVCWSKVQNPGTSDAVKRQDLAISSSGVISVPATHIDTDWGQTLGGDSFYTEIAVGQNFGDVSTPAGEKAAIYAIGATNAADNEQMAYVFANTTQATGFTNSSDTNRRLRTSSADQLASSAIQTFTNSGLSIAGVGVFQDSGRTIAQNIFKRTGAVNTTNAVPFLRAYMADAYGAALASLTNAFSAVTQTQGALSLVTANTTTISTDGAGAAPWNFTISATTPAFNRFVKAAVARVAGSHVATGPDNAASPPATFSTGNGLLTGPFPAYPRQITINGTGFSASKEPSVNAQSVYGVNSELIYGGMWSGSKAAVAFNGNNVPTGRGFRTQTLGSGPFNCIATSPIDEGNVEVDDFARVNATDVAGRAIDLAGAEVLKGRRALWDTTNIAVLDAGTNMANATDQDLPLGYGNGTNASLDVVAAPADTDTQILYHGFADITQNTINFTLTNISSAPDFGSGLDQANFGWKSQQLMFITADLSIKCSVTPTVAQSDPTLTVRFGIEILRFNATDGSLAKATPDVAPSYTVLALNQDGTTTQLSSGTATATAIPSDFYADVVIPVGYQAVKVIAFGVVNSAPTPGGGEATVQIGYAVDTLGTFVGIHLK